MAVDMMMILEGWSELAGLAAKTCQKTASGAMKSMASMEIHVQT